MRMRKLGFLVAFISCVLFVTSAWGADVVKIGVVDFQKILATSEAGKKAKTDISEKMKTMQGDLEAMGKDLEESKKRLEREGMVMTKEKREQKERDLQHKYVDFKAKEKKYKKEIAEINQGLAQKFGQEIYTLAEEIGKKEGYLLIVEKRAVLYSPSTIDITDRLIQAYNEKYAKSSN